MRQTIALIAVLAAALLWTILAALPPAARGADAPATAFSAARAFADIEALAVAPRPVGSPGNARGLSHLTTRLKAMGAELSEQPVPIDRRALDALAEWSGTPQPDIVGRNLIGVFPGKDRSKPAIVLMAHHDSVWGSPGAADDASGVAVAIEAARALLARGRPERDVVVLLTDSEEMGLNGASAFFGDAPHPIAARTGIIINLEARGAGGRANMFETGAGNGDWMRLYADVVDRPATNSLSVLIYEMMPNSTDYTIAKKSGTPGFNIAFMDRAYTYHSPMSVPSAVDPRSVQDMGDQTLALAAALAFAADLPGKADNAAFADLMGRTTIVYPAWAGWLILLTAAALIGTAFSRTRPRPAAIARGALVTVTLLLHGALLLTAFNALSGSGGANYYDRLAALPRLEMVAALLVIALLACFPAFRRPAPRLLAIAPAMALMWVGLLAGGNMVTIIAMALPAMAAAWFLPLADEDRGEGALLMLFLLAMIGQLFVPTAGPLLQWPLLLAALSLAARAWLPATPALIVAAIAAAIGVGHLMTQAHFVFLGVGADLPAVLMVNLFAVWPLLRPLWPERPLRWLPAVALVAALGIALWVRLDPMAPSVPGYSLKHPAKSKD